MQKDCLPRFVALVGLATWGLGCGLLFDAERNGQVGTDNRSSDARPPDAVAAPAASTTTESISSPNQTSTGEATPPQALPRCTDEIGATLCFDFTDATARTTDAAGSGGPLEAAWLAALEAGRNGLPAYDARSPEAIYLSLPPDRYQNATGFQIKVGFRLDAWPEPDQRFMMFDQYRGLAIRVSDKPSVDVLFNYLESGTGHRKFVEPTVADAQGGAVALDRWYDLTVQLSPDGTLSSRLIAEPIDGTPTQLEISFNVSLPYFARLSPPPLSYLRLGYDDSDRVVLSHPGQFIEDVFQGWIDYLAIGFTYDTR